MAEKIKTETDRNKGRYEQACHKALCPVRDGARPVQKEQSNQRKAPKNNVRADHPLKIMRQTLEGVRQRMPAGVNDRPSPEAFKHAGAPEDEACQGIRHNASEGKSGQPP